MREPPGKASGALADAGRLLLPYRLSLVVAVLMGIISLMGFAFGSRLLGSVGTPGAAAVTVGPAGVLVPGFVAQDLLNLVVGLPILLASVWLARHGALIGLLLWPGALFSVLYTYVHYLVATPFSGLFLVVVALVGLSGFAIIHVIASIDADAARQQLTRSVPARTIGGILIVLALLTIVQDVGGVIVTAFAGAPLIDQVAHRVWVADLVLGAPATFIGGVLLWRRASLGYATAPALLLAFSLTPLELAIMLALQPQLTGLPIDVPTIVGLLVFAAVAVGPLAFFLPGAGGSAAGSRRILQKGVAVWLGIIAVETLHGIVRTSLLAPLVGDWRARQVAVFTGSFLILVVAVSFIRWIRPASNGEAVIVGIVWLVLTLAFEIGLGRYVVEAPWSRIMSDYDLRHGGLLPIGLLVLTAAPLIAAKYRHVL